MKKLLAVTSGAALVLCGLAGSTATAAPGEGTVRGDAVTGTLEGPTRAQQDGVRLRTNQDMTVTTFELTYKVGGYSGWHRHPGIVLATVKSGVVRQQVGCRTYTWRAGQSVTEVEPHFVSNRYRKAGPGAVDAVLSITQIFPADAPLPPREEVDPPRCRRHGG